MPVTMTPISTSCWDGRCAQPNCVERAGDGGGGGLLVIQLDGVGAGTLRDAMTAGSLPTLARWLQSRTHVVNSWYTGLPATTPAAQAVLLHGDVEEIPSFRWFEKETGRMLVANHPRDAGEIERRISDGAGLLAEGGVSVSNLFSGDAPIRFLTMSDARLPARETHGLASFAAARGGFARCLVLSVGTAITELYQGVRQRWRNLDRACTAAGSSRLQRAVTTVLLRDVTISIVAEQIALGAPAIFVDFIDFDEVAHHAGPSRPESIRTLAPTGPPGRVLRRREPRDRARGTRSRSSPITARPRAPPSPSWPAGPSPSSSRTCRRTDVGVPTTRSTTRSPRR